MQIKTTVRDHLPLVRMVIMKKSTKKKKNAGEGVKKREHFYTVGETVNGATMMENSMEVSQKTKNRATI